MTGRDSTYFLIVSGNRAGSTWLELSLNALQDVSASLEMHWAKTAPTPLHVAMLEPGFDLLRKLDQLRDGRSVAGSKLVLPGQDRLENIDGIPDRIPELLRIVHLSRRYVDSYLSRVRNGGHLRNADGVGSAHPWLSDSLVEKTFCSSEPIELDLLEARGNFERRLSYDEQIRRLDNGHRKYLLVDYESLAAQFRDIARHVGSNADDGELLKVISAPPTRKLPTIEYKKLICNYEELIELSSEFERRRQAILADHLSSSNA